LAAIQQVDLGIRVHNNRSLHALGRTSFEVLAAFLTRMADQDRVTLHAPLGDALRQFDVDNNPFVSHPDVMELPPWRSLRSKIPGLDVIGIEERDPKSFGRVSAGTSG
jgi:hypothetical protein